MTELALLIAQYLPAGLLALITIFFKYVVLEKLKKMDFTKNINENTTTVNQLVDRVYNLRTDVDDTINAMKQDLTDTINKMMEEQQRVFNLAMAELRQVKERNEALLQDNTALRAELRRKHDDRKNEETENQ